MIGSTSSDFQTAKDIGEGAVDVIKNINKFNLAIKIGKDSNKSDLKGVVKLLSGSGLSKISAGMGALSAVFGFVSLFTGAKTTEELMFEMLGEISKKIDNLQSLMLGKFDRLEAVVEQVGANTTLTGAFSIIDAAVHSVDGLLKTKNDAERKQALRSLREFESKEFRQAVSAINLTVVESTLSNNVYTSNLKTSYGDAGVILDIGRTLNYYILAAQMMENIINVVSQIPDDELFSIALKNSDKNPLDRVPESYVAPINAVCSNSEEYYSGHLKKNSKKWEESLSVTEKEFKSYMDKYFKSEMVTDLDAKKRSAAASLLVENLKAKWWWLDFFAVVYDNVGGYDNHAMRGGDYKKYFHESIKNGTVNIVFAWMDKEKSPNGSKCDTLVQYTSFRNVRHGHIVKIESVEVKGQAEDLAKNQKDLRKCRDNFVNNKAVDGKRFIWMCKKKKGAAKATSNSKRLLWKNGKGADVAVFE